MVCVSDPARTHPSPLKTVPASDFALLAQVDASSKALAGRRTLSFLRSTVREFDPSFSSMAILSRHIAAHDSLQHLEWALNRMDISVAEW